jgi:hypothetical protein
MDKQRSNTNPTKTRERLSERFLCYFILRSCSVRRNHNPVLSSFMTYHRVCNKSNRTGATRGTGTTYPSGAHEFVPGLIVITTNRT